MTYLTVAEQKLLLLMLKYENVGVSYKTQKIFGSKKFYGAVSVLKKNNLAMTICAKCKTKIKEENRNVCNKCRPNTNEKFYRLTLEGEIVTILLKNIKRE